jgi:hypothetical protein
MLVLVLICPEVIIKNGGIYNVYKQGIHRYKQFDKNTNWGKRFISLRGQSKRKEWL